MRAITIPEPGGPEALVWEEVPDPVPGESEVLVEVVVGAVNRADLPQRQGVTRSDQRWSAISRYSRCRPCRLGLVSLCRVVINVTSGSIVGRLPAPQR